jgi:hypothetical protein
MPREIDPRPATVQHPQPQQAPQPQQPALPPRPSGGRNLRLLHQVDNWPKGHVIAPEELGHGASVQRLLSIGAVAETDDPATGPLDASALPPGAAVTHQLVPGDELPPNTLERVDPEKEKAIAEANAKAIAEQSGGDATRAKGK